MLSTMKGVLLALTVFVTVCEKVSSQATSATCTIVSGSGVGTVAGVIKLSQASPNASVTMTINLSGLLSNSTAHGFHVHQTASIANACNASAGHLNVNSTLHGAPWNPVATRHTGDWGNINTTDASGNIVANFTDWLVSLTPGSPYYIVGLPIVIHADMDDLGLGSFNDSSLTGHAGGRLGCCLITTDVPSNGTTAASPSASTTSRTSSSPSLVSAVTTATYALTLALLGAWLIRRN